MTALLLLVKISDLLKRVVHHRLSLSEFVSFAFQLTLRGSQVLADKEFEFFLLLVFRIAAFPVLHAAFDCEIGSDAEHKHAHYEPPDTTR